MRVYIQRFDAQLVRFMRFLTDGFIKTLVGKVFLGLALVGPLTFIPTVWIAFTAENIDALRTLTWPMMVVVNFAVLAGLCHNGDWRTRLSLVMWIVLTFLVWLATIIR